jgi:hypothetical protein
MIPTDPLFHKPQSIIAAKNILYATLFLGILILILSEMTTDFRFYSNTPQWVISLIILGTIGVLTRQIGLGRKWARLLFLIAFLILGMAIPYALLPLFKASFLIEVLFIFYALLQILALIFLFSQKSTDWFNRVHSTEVPIHHD